MPRRRQEKRTIARSKPATIRNARKSAPKSRAKPRRPAAIAPNRTRLDFHPLTPDRWPDLEKLFGPRGACGGCWCMAWRRPRGEWEKSKGEPNRKAFKKIVESNEPPGVLAYAGGEPVGWCAIAPRQTYVVLERSRVLKPVDDRPVWSVSCYFIAREWRRRGVSVGLLQAAANFAKSRGAKLIEGYPVVPYTARMPDAFAWTGIPQTFEKAGFTEVARRSKARPIFRREV
ncbi:MAG: GNAT family N-acetyltransferase [Planctomycetes bacterium]|nr:GNAT family N-acetyltransferase [Planctomycetota bacterium]